MFGIKYLYPSIQKELLNKGLKFAEGYKYTSDKDREIIYHALKSLFFWPKEHMDEKSRVVWLTSQWEFTKVQKYAN